MAWIKLRNAFIGLMSILFLSSVFFQNCAKVSQEDASSASTTEGVFKSDGACYAAGGKLCVESSCLSSDVIANRQASCASDGAVWSPQCPEQNLVGSCLTSDAVATKAFYYVGYETGMSASDEKSVLIQACQSKLGQWQNN